MNHEKTARMFYLTLMYIYISIYYNRYYNITAVRYQNFIMLERFVISHSTIFRQVLI